MTTPIQAARAASRLSIQAVDGRTVTVTRGVDSFTITDATIGETRAEEYEEEVLVTGVRIRDYLIDYLDYDFGSGPVAPVAGDYITEQIGNGQTLYFEVLPVGGQPDYREHDRDRTVWRLHTKERQAP